MIYSILWKNYKVSIKYCLLTCISYEKLSNNHRMNYKEVTSFESDSFTVNAPLYICQGDKRPIPVSVTVFPLQLPKITAGQFLFNLKKTCEIVPKRGHSVCFLEFNP